MMMRRLIVSLIAVFCFGSLIAQDTIIVQTLTFDSITTRRGIWQFPEEGEFRKILMYHTLKCDPQTQHDPYNCGEWDYLTYNNVFYHTGQYDSNLYYHPNFTFINRLETDSILIGSSPSYQYWQRRHYEPTFTDTLSIQDAMISTGTLPNYTLLATNETDGKSYHLWKASELQFHNFPAGPITGIKLNIDQIGSTVDHFRIAMMHTDLEELDSLTFPVDTAHVYFNSYDPLTTGWNDFNFFEAFNWDGVSNILISFSFESAEPGTNTVVKAMPTNFRSGITTAGTNFALDLDGRTDWIDAKDDVYFSGDFTFSTWIYKRNNNNWSRVFDFGNGPNKFNVIIALSNGSSGKLSCHVNQDGLSRSFVTTDAQPLNEWIHVTLKVSGHIGWLYLNGEFEHIAPLQVPADTVRQNCYIGKSNWTNDKYADMLVDEFRIFNYAMTEDEIWNNMLTTPIDPLNNPDLEVYYNFNDTTSYVIADQGPNANHAQSYGFPKWHKIPGQDFFQDFEITILRPQIIFERIETSNLQVDTTYVLDSAINSRDQLILFDDPDDPTIPTDTIEVWQAGYQYVYLGDSIVDSVFFNIDSVFYKIQQPYYGEPYEILETFEIGRFITPYGIGLDLGPNGFRWIYDVTDYAPLLKGAVDLRAGNQQELIDLKFLFIEGTSPREVKQIDRVWGTRRSYRYNKLDNDELLSAKTIHLSPEASSFKMKARLTGHGHYSNTGNYPHCCEWKDNTHYMMVNGDTVSNWHIFQHHDCALNPVYPQGGTWPGAREGWCPGDLVKDHEKEITTYITSDSVMLDYGITPVPENNQGMGNGNYHIAMHLIQYGENKHTTDIELYNVLQPTLEDYYSRINPLCMNPQIVVRNNGLDTINTFNVDYGVTGGDVLTFEYSGTIAPHEYDTLDLPVNYNSFWIGDDERKFNVEIYDPNGLADEYSDNNVYQTHFNLPDLYGEELFILKLKTNNQAYRYHLTVKDVDGTIVFERDNMANNTIYEDTLNLLNSCYTIELIDSENMGLSYWAYPAQGSGYLKILNENGSTIKQFESEFGRSILYTFHNGEITYIKEQVPYSWVTVKPNPFTDAINLSFHEFQGYTSLKLVNQNGKVVYQKNLYLNGSDNYTIYGDWLTKGLYILQIQSNNTQISKKLIKQ